MTASSGFVRLRSVCGKILHRRVFAMVLAAVLAVLATPGDRALAQGTGGAPDEATLALYTADNVKVDVTADSAVAARDKALLDGQSRGLRQVMRGLAPAQYQDRLPDIPAKEAQNYVLSLQVEDEKRSAVRYIATLDITYNPDAVRQLLRMNNIPFSEQVSTPVLVVPLWQAAGAAGPILWDDPNPWRETWNRRNGEGVVPTRVPLGDLGDLQAVSADEAAGGDAEAVRALLQRYDMTEAVVARVTMTGDEKMDVGMTRYRLAGDPSQHSFSLTREGTESQNDLLARAADEVVARLRDAQWDGVSASLSPDTAPDRLTAIVPTTGGLQTWLTVRERLGQVPMVQGLEVQALSRERAQVVLGYAGGVEQLALTLAQYGLDMTDLGDGVWRIEMRQSSTPSGGAGAPMVAPEAATPAGAGGPTPGQGRVMAPR